MSDESRKANLTAYVVATLTYKVTLEDFLTEPAGELALRKLKWEMAERVKKDIDDSIKKFRADLRKEQPSVVRPEPEAGH